MPMGEGSGGNPSAVRAGAAFVEVYVKDDGLVEGLKKAREKVEAFGNALKVAFAAFGADFAFKQLGRGIDLLEQSLQINRAAGPGSGDQKFHRRRV